VAFSGDARRDRTRRVADQGTFSGTPLLAAAGVAALEILKTGEVQKNLNRLGDRLRDGLNHILKTRGVHGCAYGLSSIVRVFLGADAAELGVNSYEADEARLDRGMGAVGASLHLAMLTRGVDFNRGSGITWLNAAMTDKDIDFWVDAFDSSLARLREEGALPSSP
jgi:glutamate-1-semialdehyde 2,1-aminomutase